MLAYYAELLNFDTFWYTILAITFVTITTILSEVFENWQVVKFIVVVTGFQNSEFCLKAPILALEINSQLLSLK